MRPIQPVIAMPDSQRDPVGKMVEYCRRLDGTELKVIPVYDEGFETPYPHNAFPCRQAHALRTVAIAMKKEPFLWIEPDSPPLKAGWVDILTDEYHRIGKPFMLPVLPDCKYDIASGIGIYPPETHFLVPFQFPHHGWDYWLINNLSPLIGYTRLIQHNYGGYDENGHVNKVYRFPRDNDIIRPETVVFHRDRHQDLLRNNEQTGNVFFHSGDLGDIIAAIPAIRQLGGGELVIGHKESGVRASMRGERYNVIQPLLKTCPWITSVRYDDDPPYISHDISTFRKRAVTNECDLATWQGIHLEALNLDLSPWITVETSGKSKGRIVVARSPRYHNTRFPWKSISARYRDKLLFIGLADEYANFKATVGRPVERVAVNDLVEMAQIIAGSELFIGNQSCPCWIAMALGARLIQETYWMIPNSIIERPNAMFTRNNKEIERVMETIKK